MIFWSKSNLVYYGLGNATFQKWNVVHIQVHFWVILLNLGVTSKMLVKVTLIYRRDIWNVCSIFRTLSTPGLRNRARGLGPGCTRHEFAAPVNLGLQTIVWCNPVAFSDPLLRHCLCPDKRAWCASPGLLENMCLRWQFPAMSAIISFQIIVEKTLWNCDTISKSPLNVLASVRLFTLDVCRQQITGVYVYIRDRKPAMWIIIKMGDTGAICVPSLGYTLSCMTGCGHVKYMASPFFDLYMTACHV